MVGRAADRQANGILPYVVGPWQSSSSSLYLFNVKLTYETKAIQDKYSVIY